MKTLITGANGQVGWELRHLFASLGEVVAIDKDELDLTQESLIRSFVRNVRPDLIINAAAYTAVDQAESEPELAFKINAEAPRILSEEARDLKAPFITYSTDYVFDGTANEPYREDAHPNPLNAYGRSKLAGDLAVQSVGGTYLILRTSWVYGSRGKNFLLTMLRLFQEREELRIVDDQFGAPTWCRDLATATMRIVQQASYTKTSIFDWLSERSGIYNVTNSGETSWYGFACEIAAHVPKKSSLLLFPISTADYPTPATRPRRSCLSGVKLSSVFDIKLPRWEASLEQVGRELEGRKSAIGPM